MMDNTNNKFNLYFDSKIIRQTINELYDKLDKGVIWGNSYLFDDSSSSWVLINEHPVFKKFNIIFELNQVIPKKPKRIPTSNRVVDDKATEDLHLVEYVENYKNKLEDVMEYNLSLINENIALKLELRSTNSDLKTSKSEYDLHIKSLNKDLSFYIKYQNDQDLYCKKLEKEIDSLRKISSEKNTCNINTFSRLTKENSELHKMLEKKEEYLSKKNIEIRRLVKDIQKLESENESLESYDKEKSDDIIQILNGEIRALSMEISKDKELEKKFKLIEIEKEKVVFENNKLRDVIAELNQSLEKTVNEKVNIEKNYLQFQKKYKKDINTVKNSFLNYEQKIKFEKSKNSDLNNSLTQELSKNQKLTELLNQNKQVHKLVGKRTKKNLDSSVGKVFEIDNSSHWEIKGHNEKYRFSDIKKMLDDNEIFLKTFIRKQGAWWKKVSDVSELHNPLLTQTINGEDKCYIERGSFRVPLSFGKAEVTISTGAILTGKCVNISTDGCFIEMKDLNELNLDHEEVLGLKIKLDEFNEVDFKGVLKQFSADKLGFGVEITEIETSMRKTLSSFVNSFITSLDKVA